VTLPSFFFSALVLPAKKESNAYPPTDFVIFASFSVCSINSFLFSCFPFFAVFVLAEPFNQSYPIEGHYRNDLQMSTL
jgi:hypothetical protein